MCVVFIECSCHQRNRKKENYSPVDPILPCFLRNSFLCNWASAKTALKAEKGHKRRNKRMNQIFQKIFKNVSYTVQVKKFRPLTITNENQRGLTLGFPILKLNCVGTFIFKSKVVHNHLNSASCMVALNLMCLENR